MKLTLLLAILISSPWALAQPAFAPVTSTAPTAALPLQDAAALRQVAQDYLQTQAAALPGEVKITIGAVNQKMALPACAAPQAFQQPGARAWGKTTVGVRCAAPQAWTVYIQAQVSVIADYVAAAVPLAQGQPIEAGQLVMVKGDIAALPNGVVTDMAQAVGRSSTMSLPSGAPLRLDTLRSKPVVQQGQMVKVVSNGKGFSVSAEAKAIGTAGAGQIVQVRTPGGAILSGVAQAGGLVEVAF